MKTTNNSNMPDIWVKACTQDNYSGSHEEGYSVTQLLQPNKIILLKERHPDEVFQDVRNMQDSVFGTACHKVIEDAITPESVFNAKKVFDRHLMQYFRGNVSFDIMLEDFKDEMKARNIVSNLLKDTDMSHIISEQRYAIEVAGKRLSGGVDIINTKELLIADIKTLNTYKIELMTDIEKWKLQLNIYRYMYYKITGIAIEKLQIWALMKDWSLAKYENKKIIAGQYGYVNYPDAGFKIIDIDLMRFEEVEAFLVSKIEILESLKETPDDEIKECTGDERWGSETVYKMYIKNAKLTDYNKTAKHTGSSEEQVRAIANKSINKDCKDYAQKELDKLDAKGKLDGLLPFDVEAKRKVLYDKKFDELMRRYENPKIVKIDGLQKRCEWYCACKHLCHYYKELHKDE
jgi:hypothetical protein